MYNHIYEKIIQHPYVGLLYEDGAFKRVLPSGKHKFKDGFFTNVIREIRLVDQREQSLTIKGQEILTQDKVAIRVSLLVYYKITDPSAALHNVASFDERIYEDVQLAARRFLASRKLDEILNDRNEISTAVRDDVKHAAESYGVEVLRADVKDLVFPGRLREIMNHAIEADRESEAIIIKARKEAEAAKISVESERQKSKLQAEGERELSQLRMEQEVEQAKLIEKYPSLLRLRRLETLEAMAKKGGKFEVQFNAEEV